MKRPSFVMLHTVSNGHETIDSLYACNSMIQNIKHIVRKREGKLINILP